jgi:hypothetical protein
LLFYSAVHRMKPIRNYRQRLLSLAAMICMCWLFSSLVVAQTCLTANDMEAATRTALINTAQRYFAMVPQGDVASLRQNSIPSLAGNFGGVEAVVTEQKANLAGVQSTARPPFLLKAEGTAPLERGEFLCGVFTKSGQTSDSAVFVIPNLPPGDYAVVMLDAATSKGPYAVSFVLQEQGGAWKLAGFYIKSMQAAGHDAKWFLDHARDFKTKNQPRNAWLYSLTARELMVPVSFMSVQATDKLYDEFQNVKPADFPPADIAANGKTFKVTSLFLLPVNQEIDLIVKYHSDDVSDTAKIFQDNMAFIKALIAKYPEFRNAFDEVVARAVEPSGRDFGSMLPMKDIK